MVENNFETSEDPEYIIVDTEEWKTAEAPNFLETTPLGPCIGIIIYDPRNKKAMCGHFASPTWSVCINEMLDEALRIFPEKRILRVYVGGSDPADIVGSANFREERAFVLQTLRNYGLQDSQIEIRWQDPNQSTVLSINTATGKVEYDAEDMDD